MGLSRSPNPQLAARIRKHFNRQHPNLRSGELVRCHDGRVGEYQGISTFDHPNFISVMLYETNTNNSNDLDERVVHELPETFRFGEQDLPIRFNIQERPEISPGRYGGSYYPW